ncbi:MAG: HAD family hydrolase [Ruminococcaceae bacterium]|nr:HAD family hydrolase [Oscillospiraceae bacterium]
MKPLKNYKAIFFDLDGTLTDSCTGILNSVAYALEKLGEKVPPRNELLSFVGPPLIDEFKRKFNFSQEKAEEAVRFFREYFRDTGIFENTPYDGIKEILCKLKNAGYVLAVATSKPEEFALRIAKHFGLDEYFEFICGSTFDESRNKKHQVLEYAISTVNKVYNFSKSEMLIVGDRHHDIDGAKYNGIDSMGVLYGYGSEEELRAAGADYIVAGVSDIATVILS